MWRITHSCGHEQEHYIIGEFAADYDRRATRLSRRKCDACQATGAALVASQTRTIVLGLDLAMLEGSPKQIAWAETIRAKRISVLDRSNREAVTFVARITDAKWWIDRRSDLDEALIASARSYLSINVGEY